ncbi:hypothetical protein [Acidovorax sp. CCYZU-2555]|uniref:hypothetical protein n=1 Tax=Acidovorax sp. CCYZU-2555 TaxID=2835042 RepID=UPI001BCFA0D1|nr:hypothetical protein [Acidovorax sp. CCYZU-2555]MBS7776922.1 hypothetical protein [Acidovorax sp. CCYZU-2555]
MMTGFLFVFGVIAAILSIALILNGFFWKWIVFPIVFLIGGFYLKDLKGEDFYIGVALFLGLLFLWAYILDKTEDK